MNEIVTYLQKLEHPLDQTVVGLVRASKTLNTVAQVLASIRAANLGPDSNAVVDELIKITSKLQVITGNR
jgi:acetaldehyde dehydrogenase (acetylating)